MPTRDARARTADLRAAKPEALETLAQALEIAGGSITDAAALLGLAGPSTLWRVAYDVPAVKEILTKHSRGRGRKKPCHTPI